MKSVVLRPDSLEASSFGAALRHKCLLRVLKKTGLIIPMGYWALEQACQQIQKWERAKTQFLSNCR